LAVQEDKEESQEESDQGDATPGKPDEAELQQSVQMFKNDFANNLLKKQ
jgi:hypothetical protein